jgi:hypothetical protein
MYYREKKERPNFFINNYGVASRFHYIVIEVPVWPDQIDTMVEITIFQKGHSKDGTDYVVIRKDVKISNEVKTLSAIISVKSASHLIEGVKVPISSQLDRMIRWQGLGKKNKYQSHCFKCGQSINSENNNQCENCLRYECVNCGSCYCDYQVKDGLVH